MEIGAGDCALSLEAAKYARKVYAIDIADVRSRNSEAPTNFEFRITNGLAIPVDRNSIDFAFSNHVMEHLHPDDAVEQLQEILTALRPGGIYLCVTPNRLCGPSDVSKYFDHVATGFHLKEYTIGELTKLFSEVGFSHTKVYIGAKGRYFFLPPSIVVFLENVLCRLPYQARASLTHNQPAKSLLTVRLFGKKDYKGN